jgi:hypothetical protein
MICLLCSGCTGNAIDEPCLAQSNRGNLILIYCLGLNPMNCCLGFEIFIPMNRGDFVDLLFR